MSIDGIRKKPNIKPQKKRQPVVFSDFKEYIVLETETVVQNFIPQKPSRSFRRLFTFQKIKTPTLIVSTIAITFLLSVATSQGLAKYIRQKDSSIKNIAINTRELPLSSVELRESERPDILGVTSQPNNAILGDVVINDPGMLYLPIEKITVPDPLTKRKEFLEQYLKAKGSPLANHVDTISEQSQWKLIIAISRAESSFCKRQRLNNCWGIGGAWNLRNYANFDQAVTDVNRILEQYYISAGLNSPSKMVRKWVGHESENWELAVEQELKALEEVE